MATITARQQRRLQRSFHLLAAATLLYYVYVPAAHSVHDLVRFVAFPVLALTGLAMWQAARLRRAVRLFRQGWGFRRPRAEEREDPAADGAARRRVDRAGPSSR